MQKNDFVWLICHVSHTSCGTYDKSIVYLLLTCNFTVGSNRITWNLADPLIGVNTFNLPSVWAICNRSFSVSFTKYFVDELSSNCSLRNITISFESLKNSPAAISLLRAVCAYPPTWSTFHFPCRAIPNTQIILAS